MPFNCLPELAVLHIMSFLTSNDITNLVQAVNTGQMRRMQHEDAKTASRKAGAILKGLGYSSMPFPFKHIINAVEQYPETFQFLLQTRVEIKGPDHWGSDQHVSRLNQQMHQQLQLVAENYPQVKVLLSGSTHLTFRHLCEAIAPTVHPNWKSYLVRACLIYALLTSESKTRIRAIADMCL